MNTTKNISMGGYAFIVEEDAYLRLKAYTDSVRRNLAGSPGVEEIMGDIEARIAEILRENKGGREVVNNDDITAVISRMGEPEVYAQDDTGTAQKPQPDTDDGSGERRLHRDPDNKILGGVCGGLGAFAGIDPIWFRLLFVGAVLLPLFLWTFLLATMGMWIYVVLWVIMPLAKTRVQKLQMRGKRPDLKNIENSIRSELNDMGKNINKMASDGTIRDGARRATDVAGDIFSRLFRVFGKVLEALLKVFSVFVILGCLVFLVALVFMASTGIRSVEVMNGEVNIRNFRDVVPHLFESPTEGWTFYLCAFLFLAIPAVALMANAIRYLADLNTKTPKWVSFAGVGVWLLVSGWMVYSGIRLGMDFTQNASGKTEQTFALPEGQALNLRLERVTDPADGFTLSDVSLDILEAPDSLYTLRIYRSANGGTHAVADRRQRSIMYEPVLRDSVLYLPDFLTLAAGEVLREQSVTLELRIPRNRKVYLDWDMEYILNGVDNVQNMHDSEMPGQYWIMSDRGLSCQGCAIPPPDSSEVDEE